MKLSSTKSLLLLLLLVLIYWERFFFKDFVRFLPFFFVPLCSFVLILDGWMDDFFGSILTRPPRRRADGSTELWDIICKRRWSSVERRSFLFLLFDRLFASSARSNRSSRKASTSDLWHGNGRSVIVASDSESKLRK